MKFNIRKNALKLLAHIYQHCNTNFQVKDLDCRPLLDNETTQSDLILANRYLWEKRYIDNKPMVIDKFSCDITALGIDWVEECHEKNLI